MILKIRHRGLKVEWISTVWMLLMSGILPLQQHFDETNAMLDIEDRTEYLPHS
ncbi:MAG: hypothetical protein ACXWT0_02175 [Methylobacter sp.]